MKDIEDYLKNGDKALDRKKGGIIFV